jgi:hypothetical protein
MVYQGIWISRLGGGLVAFKIYYIDDNSSSNTVIKSVGPFR